MSELSVVFLSKAHESLAGVTSELANGRDNNAANRAYYACFQAAIAALDLAGIRPSDEWGHRFVQAQFAGEIITRRKRYPAQLRDTLSYTWRMRTLADYEMVTVSQTQAARAVARARTFVTAIAAQGETAR